ncbi:MAG: DNA mismatch repair endonuclease MutL [Bacilli bacterium]|nr:DNA mismatch repair endonuclease MutL [Bacilli bacterium]
MSKIKQMDEILANKIAAGEVVERCASVVKELVENSIDANSREIKIDLIEAGTKEIKVTDDGVGMDREDAVLAFSRHATSKIKDEEDLFHITTLGFRGEALASIASVSHVHMETCSSDVGTMVEINGGKLDNVAPALSRRGTQIIIRDLFYNTPARLKHMKSLYTELASITDYVNKIALSHPDIKFVLTNNGGTLLNTDGSGNLLKVIKSIYGIETVKKMVDVSISDDDYEITGFISLPEVHRSSRNTMITLVNGRVVRNQDLNRVINDAYHSYKPDNRYPIVVINIDVDPTLVDVNVHPTKMDIKFSKMEELLNLVSRMIKEKIKEKILIPHLEVESPIVMNTSFIEENNRTDEIKPLKTPKYVEQTLKFDIDNNFTINEEIDKYTEEEKREFPNLSFVGVVHSTYIICQDESGMYLVDQHAAKERVNYELFKERMGHPNTEIEKLLFPITIELSTNEYIVLRENFNVLEDMGFDVEEFGINSIIIKSHPTWIPKDQAEESIKRIIELIVTLEDKFDIEKFNESAATMLACKLAIKANQYVSEEELVELLHDLKKCKNPFNCPHGRPTIVFYSNYDLEKMFKRSGFENFKTN